MKNSRSGEKIKLTSIDELLGVVNEESAMEIEIKAISPFKGHPFKVIADDKMAVIRSVKKKQGVFRPEKASEPARYAEAWFMKGKRTSTAVTGIVILPCGKRPDICKV